MPQVTDPSLLATLEKPQTAIDAPEAIAKLIEGERDANAFLIRALGANKSYEGLNIGPRSYIGQSIAEIAPDALNQLPSAIGNSPDRQIADNNQYEFVMATLRKDSGAAIPDAELERQKRLYFPTPGESDAAVEAKRQARLRAVQGLVASAGRAPTPDTMKLVEEMLAPRADPRTDANGVPIPKGGGEFTFNDQLPPNASTSFRLTPEQEADLKAFYATKPTADQINTWWRGAGAGGAKNADQIAQALREGRSVNGVDYSLVDEIKPVDIGDGALGAGARGVADTLTLGLYPRLQAGVDTLRDGGTYDANLDRARGVRRFDEEEYGYARLAGQVGGGFALPVGAARGALGLARVGAAYGGAYGFNSEYGSMPERLAKGAEGAGIGAAAGGAFGLIANRFSRAAPGGSGVPVAGGASAADLVAMGTAERVPLSRPVVDPASRSKMAYLETMPGTNQRVREGLEGTRTGIETRTGELAGPGTVQEMGTMGATVQDAGLTYITRANTIGGRAFDRAADVSQGAAIVPKEAVTALDTYIGQLSANKNTNKNLLSYLQDVRADLVDDQGNMVTKTIADVRDFRTGLSGEISARNLTHTRAEHIIGQVLDAARLDISRDLVSNPGALKAYARADRIWKETRREIKQVVDPIVGPKDNMFSGEQVMAKLRALSAPKGASEKYARTLEKLEPDARDDVVATIADSLGRKSPDEPFSPALLVSHLNTFSPSALRSTFGATGAKSFENLKALSTAYRDTVGQLNNSRSGQVMNWRSYFRDLFTGGGLVTGGGFGALAGGPTGALTGAALGAVAGLAVSGVQSASRRISAKALMNPDLSRWLAATSRINTAAGIAQHTRRLTVIAKANPGIAVEVNRLSESLSNALSEGASRAAAGENVDRGRQEPPRQQSPQQ